MKKMKLLVVMILTLGVIVSLAGCRAAEPAMHGGQHTELPTEPPTDLPGETTEDKIPIHEDVPEITLDPSEPQGAIGIGGDVPGIGEVPGVTDQELKILRVQDVDQSVIEDLIRKLSEDSMGDVPFAHLRSLADLSDLLETVGSAYLEECCAVYDQSFFATHDLLVIPRVTNTGSARHTAEVICDDGGVVVQLRVEVPEIVTMDMANWCLVVAVPKTSTQDGDVTVIMNGGMPMPIQSPIGSVGR